MLDEVFEKRVISYENALRQIAAQAMLSGIPVPAMANAISYLDLFTKNHVGANLIQAQRDYFGAHTFERIDKDGSFITNGGNSMENLTFTIFGGTGDLTFRKLLPAFYNLQAQKKLADDFQLLSLAVEHMTMIVIVKK